MVGVSWYEAQAYCAWLAELLAWLAAADTMVTEVKRALLAAGAQTVRLLSDAEWTRCAGGAEKDRYPWDGTRRATATSDVATITAQANVAESGLGQTSPVAQYPQSASVPFGLIPNVQLFLR